mmetsp:Transcript_42333/g.136765  ORF Transcript_42333/g.136765 Transcript_42333/m.136765 type:complete len:218 (-) Transcript_42333:460-1113(-)
MTSSKALRVALASASSSITVTISADSTELTPLMPSTPKISLPFCTETHSEASPTTCSVDLTDEMVSLAVCDASSSKVSVAVAVASAPFVASALSLVSLPSGSLTFASASADASALAVADFLAELDCLDVCEALAVASAVASAEALTIAVCATSSLTSTSRAGSVILTVAQASPTNLCSVMHSSFCLSMPTLQLSPAEHRTQLAGAELAVPLNLPCEW